MRQSLFKTYIFERYTFISYSQDGGDNIDAYIKKALWSENLQIHARNI